MSGVLARLEGVTLVAGSPALDLRVAPGDRLAVLGPAGAGKSRFLGLLTGTFRPVSGLAVCEPAVAAGLPSLRRFRTAGRWAAGMARRSGWDASAALASIGLWEARNQAFDDLTPGQRAAAAVLPCLLGEESLAVIDGHLDAMDPWTLPRLLDYLAGQASAKAFVVATGRPDVAEALGQMLVLSNGTPVFAGRTSDLVRSAGPVEVLVETDDPSTVRSMVEPLAVSVKAVAGGLVVRTERGQETAAKLLTQGYGSVRALVVREATVAEALARLI